MERNGYERYSEWIDIIGKKCTAKNQVGTKRKLNHHILENGLHVYTNDFHTIIADVEITDFANNNYTCLRKDIIESANIGFSLPGKSYIIYRPDGSKYNYTDGITSRDFARLGQSKFSGARPQAGELNPDIRELLINASNGRDVNSSGKTMYKKAIAFYDMVEEMVSPELTVKKDEDEELDNLSVEELEELLNKTKAENDAKREEAYRLQRKAELIRLIKEAQEEGRDLDGKIKHYQELIEESEISR